MNRAADQPDPNPLREGLSPRAVPQPCSIVIFGATGDLTHRKLIPALYNLAADGDLPPAVAIVGFARREKSDDQFRSELEEATRKFSRQPVRDEIWKMFAQSIFYHQSEFADESGYEKLAKRLDKIDKERGTRGNRLFYFAAAPDQFEPILKHLKAAGLNETCKGSWARVIVEKPFGSDLASARELNRIVRNSFTEEQTYRIDHFLGKETAQNILVLRFANAIFAPLWNTHYIDQVQITAAETLGVEMRAGYYERAGALRDMVQNHLLQLLCLVAMEPPTDLSADSIRDEKVKVVRSLRRLPRNEVAANVVRGQYTEGAIHGEPVVRLSPGAKRETGFANGNVCRIASFHRQLALGRCADLHACRKTPSEIGYGDFRPFQKSSSRSVQQRPERPKRACHQDSARRRNFIADPGKGPGREFSHRAG